MRRARPGRGRPTSPRAAGPRVVRRRPRRRAGGASSTRRRPRHRRPSLVGEGVEDVGRDEPAQRAFAGCRPGLEVDARQAAFAHGEIGGADQLAQEVAEVRIMPDEGDARPRRTLFEERDEPAQVEARCQAIVDRRRNVDRLADDARRLERAHLRRRHDRVRPEADRREERAEALRLASPLRGQRPLGIVAMPFRGIPGVGVPEEVELHRHSPTASSILPPAPIDGANSSAQRATSSLVRTNAARRSSSVPATAAGSGNARWTYARAPGTTGHASRAWSHTVTTTSYGRSSTSETSFERRPVASIPASSSALTVSGWTVFGWAPALTTSNRPAAARRRRASAKMLRAELPVQTTRTRGRCGRVDTSEVTG